MEKDNISFSEKNKLSYTAIKIVKENIIKSKEPTSNPIVLVGLDKSIRYRIFLNIFDKKFNNEHKGIYTYSSCSKLDLKEIENKRLIIVEEIDLLNKNETLQNKINELLMICLKNKIQIILCSNTDIKDLEISETLKSKILSGLILYLMK